MVRDDDLVLSQRQLEVVLERGSEDISCKNDPAMTAWNSSALDSGSSASVMARRYESVATI